VPRDPNEPVRLTRIYTRGGDKGETSLGDGSRVSKLDPRVAAIGDVDELNSNIGVLLCEPLPDDVPACLSEVQHDLFDLGGEICIPGHTVIGDAHLARLDGWLAHYNADLPPLKEFVLPGGNTEAAACHLARAVARRAERSLWLLNESEPVNPVSLRFANRLSDLLFVSARVLARADGGKEVSWQRT